MNVVLLMQYHKGATLLHWRWQVLPCNLSVFQLLKVLVFGLHFLQFIVKSRKEKLQIVSCPLILLGRF